VRAAVADAELFECDFPEAADISDRFVLPRLTGFWVVKDTLAVEECVCLLPRQGSKAIFVAGLYPFADYFLQRGKQ
jgi:hypothetical protein